MISFKKHIPKLLVIIGISLIFITIFRNHILHYIVKNDLEMHEVYYVLPDKVRDNSFHWILKNGSPMAVHRLVLFYDDDGLIPEHAEEVLAGVTRDYGTSVSAVRLALEGKIEYNERTKGFAVELLLDTKSEVIHKVMAASFLAAVCAFDEDMSKYEYYRDVLKEVVEQRESFEIDHIPDEMISDQWVLSCKHFF